MSSSDDHASFSHESHYTLPPNYSTFPPDLPYSASISASAKMDVTASIGSRSISFTGSHGLEIRNDTGRDFSVSSTGSFIQFVTTERLVYECQASVSETATEGTITAGSVGLRSLAGPTSEVFQMYRGYYETREAPFSSPGVQTGVLEAGTYLLSVGGFNQFTNNYGLGKICSTGISFSFSARTLLPGEDPAPGSPHGMDHATPWDEKAGNMCPALRTEPALVPALPFWGMAAYNFDAMLASLRITDTPVGHVPPLGPAVPFSPTYTQRTTSQPETFDFANLGPKWNFNWLGYITDDPADSTSAGTLNPPGGGRLPTVYLGRDASHELFQFIGNSSLRLRRSLAGPVEYQVIYPDGSMEVYGHPDGSPVAPRRMFLTRRVDPAGNAVTVSYDAQLRITKLTDALGQETHFSYGLAAAPLRITAVTDPFGRSATFGYDGAGRLVSITDVIGMVSAFTYEGAGDFINSLTTPYGTTTFTHSENGEAKRVTATDPAGDTEVIESNPAQTPGIPDSEDASKLPVGMGVANVDLSRRNSFHWNKKQWKEGANDYTKAHTYHWLKESGSEVMSGSLASEKSPLQSRIWYRYPGQADPSALAREASASLVGRVIEGGSQMQRRSIGSLGKPVEVVDPLNRTTLYSYSGDGVDLLRVGRLVGGELLVLDAFTYDGRHLPLTRTDAGGQMTTYTWNAFGQPVTIANAKGESTTFSYYEADEAGKQRKGRLRSIDGALPGDADLISFDYDARGNTASITGPDGYSLAFAYDGLDRPIRTTYPDATYEEVSYQALDPKTRRDRLGRITTYNYNAIRQLEEVTDPANRTIRYRWCKCGAMSQLVDAMGRITRWKHDIAGHMTSKEYADGSEITYAYEALSGRLHSTTDEKGQVKTRSYNLDDTLAKLAYTHEEHETPDVAFTYDTGFRRLKTMLDGTGTTTYGYRPIAAGSLGAGELASVDGPLPNDTLTYSYDELGRNTGYAINGVGETRSFDPLGRLLSAVNPLGTFGYTYVGATGRMDKVSYPNGMTCQYNYHPLAGDFRLKDIIYTLPGDALLSRHSYEYNAVGSITRWTQISPQAGLNRSWLCGYDAADQLTSVASQDPDTLTVLPTGQYAYSYDPAGNRLTETIDGVTATANFNALNQLISLNTAGASTLPRQTYEWDAENRLSAINYTGTNERSELLYDGCSRCNQVIEKQGNDVIFGLRLAWENFQLVEQRDIVEGTLRNRFFSRGIQTSTSGGTLEGRMITRDHLGSVRELISGASSVTGAYDFGPWGERSTSLEEFPLSFTGHWIHGRSRLTSSPYRLYDPRLGRWMSRDKIEEFGGSNLYGYVFNDPIGHFDALGLESGSVAVIELIESIQQYFDLMEPFEEASEFGYSDDLSASRLAKAIIPPLGPKPQACSVTDWDAGPLFPLRPDQPHWTNGPKGYREIKVRNGILGTDILTFEHVMMIPIWEK